MSTLSPNNAAASPSTHNFYSNYNNMSLLDQANVATSQSFTKFYESANNVKESNVNRNGYNINPQAFDIKVSGRSEGWEGPQTFVFPQGQSITLASAALSVSCLTSGHFFYYFKIKR